MRALLALSLVLLGCSGKSQPEYPLQKEEAAHVLGMLPVGSSVLSLQESRNKGFIYRWVLWRLDGTCYLSPYLQSGIHGVLKKSCPLPL